MENTNTIAALKTLLASEVYTDDTICAAVEAVLVSQGIEWTQSEDMRYAWVDRIAGALETGTDKQLSRELDLAQWAWEDEQAEDAARYGGNEDCGMDAYRDMVENQMA